MNNTLIYPNKSKKKKKKISLFDIFNYIFLAVIALICIFPVLYEVLLSVSSKADYLNSNLLVIPLLSLILI